MDLNLQIMNKCLAFGPVYSIQKKYVYFIQSNAFFQCKMAHQNYRKQKKMLRNEKH